VDAKSFKLKSMTQNDVQLETSHLILRRNKKEDAKQIHENVRRPEDRPWVYAIKDSHKLQDSIDWIEKNHEKWESREAFQFAITLKETGEVIGGSGIHSINWDHRRAEVGYLIRRQDRNKGYATEVVKALLDYAFNELKLNKISAKMYAVNEVSAKVVEKCGFKLEGTFRKELYKDGIYHDELRYGLLRKEF